MRKDCPSCRFNTPVLEVETQTERVLCPQCFCVFDLHTNAVLILNRQINYGTSNTSYFVDTRFEEILEDDVDAILNWCLEQRVCLEEGDDDCA